MIELLEQFNPCVQTKTGRVKNKLNWQKILADCLFVFG